MENINIRQSQQTNQQSDSLDIKDLIAFFWQLRHYILLFAIIALAGAYVYIKFASPQYERKAQVLLTTRANKDAQTNILSEITGIETSSNIDNELFIIKSPSLMTKVVESLGLNQSYSTTYVPKFSNAPNFLKKHFSIKTMEYYNDAPFEMDIEFDPLYSEQSRPSSISMTFIPADSNSFTIKSLAVNGAEMAAPEGEFIYGQKISLKGYTLTINSEYPHSLVRGNQYSSTWATPYNVAKSLVARLTVTNEVGTSRAKTDVLTLSFTDTKVKRAEDILNELIDQYNAESRSYQNAAIQSSLDFINARLQSISAELGDVESSYMNFQTSRSLIDIQTQSQMALSEDSEYESQLTDIRLQRSIIAMIKEDIDLTEGVYNVIPSNVGLTDANLNNVINSYNNLVAERNRLIANSSENNPRVRNTNLQLKDAKNNILLSIENLEKVYGIRESEINSQLRKSKAKVSSLPTQQYGLNQIERRQQIIEPLYLLLQQKKEEAQISIYSITDNARTIEPAYGSNSPVKPQRGRILLLAFLVGCCIPPLYVFLREYFKSKIETKDDIEKVLTNPILATIPKVEDPSLPKNSGGRDLKTESFRMLRSNLDYIQGKVLQVTSSVPGEGKSFIAANLAVSLSHVGKKVALLGLDIRKPSLNKVFSDVEFHNASSIVSYLIGKVDNPEEIVCKWAAAPNLDIVFAGSVPPNPSELLEMERVGKLMEYFRNNYDYVIVDSAPMMLVSDSISLNKYVDSTLFVIRSEYTALKMLTEIKSLFEQRNIKNPCLILNGLDLDAKMLRYGYGKSGYGYGYRRGYGRYGYRRGYGYGYGKYGYGYGKYGYGYGKYGYGYGYGYGDVDESDNKDKHRHHHRKSSKKEDIKQE